MLSPHSVATTRRSHRVTNIDQDIQDPGRIQRGRTCTGRFRFEIAGIDEPDGMGGLSEPAAQGAGKVWRGEQRIVWRDHSTAGGGRPRDQATIVGREVLHGRAVEQEDGGRCGTGGGVRSTTRSQEIVMVRLFTNHGSLGPVSNCRSVPTTVLFSFANTAGKS